MNKNLHKVIFNKKRNSVIVVAENTLREGKSIGDSGGHGSGVASRGGHGFACSLLSFSLIIASLSVAVLVPPVFAAGIEVDKTAPAAHQPVILQTGNGRFDVDNRGAVLNNSRRNVPTQLAGWIQGNPLLAGGEARIIVNQVNSSNPSLLNGYIEIAGRRAEVVMANPAGIQVNGAGFINASGVTLTTGMPVIQGANLEGFRVRRGDIAVTGSGLDTSTADYTRILSQASQIQAGIWAKDLEVVAGNYDSSVGGVHQPVSNSSTTPAIAIDTGSLGGMYAGKISLVSTDRGVGINNAGQMFATAGGIRISADGKLENTGSIAAAKTHANTADQSTAAVNIQAHSLENTGTVSAQQDLTVQAEQITNQGVLAASGQMLLNHADTIRNQQNGQIQAARLDIDTRRLNNQGQISQTGLQSLSIDTQVLSNTAEAHIGTARPDGNPSGNQNNGGNVSAPLPGQAAGTGELVQQPNTATSLPLLADGRIHVAEHLDNSGQIESNGATNLHTRRSLQNQGVLSLNQLSATGQLLDNQNGEIRAVQADVSSRAFDNRAGKVETVEQLEVSGETVRNQHGQLLSAQDIRIQTRQMDQSGTVAAGRDLSLATQRDLLLTETVKSGRDATLTTQGKLTNTADLAVGNQLQLNAAKVDNTAAGTIQAGQLVEVAAAQTLSNRGLINSNGLTKIQAGQTLDNIGTGRIFGNHVAISADTLTNREETVGQNTQAAVVAARERLDIGVRSLNNREQAVLYSANQLSIGARLTANHLAQGKAEQVDNRSATIEAAGEGRIAAQVVRNTNAHLVTDIVETAREQHVEYEAHGRNERLKEGTQHQQGWYVYTDESDHLHTPDGINHERWHKYDYNRVTRQTEVQETAPGKIIAGGRLEIDADELHNSDSQIIAGGQLAVSTAQGNAHQHETFGTATVTDEGVLHSYWRHREKGRDSTGHSQQAYRPAPQVRQFSLGSHAYREFATTLPNTSAPDNRPANVPDVSVRVDTTAIQLPGSSFFIVNPDSPHYLVETDPRFTNYRQWLGSDYMLRQLGLNQDNIHKRLGDGFYEQRLLREQIAKLTGHRFLNGYSNDEEQFKALMNNGLTAAKSFNLTPGIALSSEQVARLTSDIVWLVEQTVSLPNGGSQKVWVPQVYLRVRPGDVNGGGALLAGNVTELNIAKTLHNGGTIAGRQAMYLNAGTLENSGRISADRLQVRTSGDINNIGGVLDAGQTMLLQAGGDINSRSTLASSANGQGHVTYLDRVAGIYLTAGKDGTLAATAQGNIRLDAAELANQSENGRTLLRAGQDITLGTQRTEQLQVNHFDNDNHIIRGEQRDAGSTIRTRGELLLSAGRDLRADAADISGETVLAQAGRDIVIGSGTQTELVDDASKHTGRTGGGRKQTNTSNIRTEAQTAVGSSVLANHLQLHAGRDMTVSGSQVIANEQNRLTADGRIQIRAAENTAASQTYEREQRSGLVGGFKDGVASVGYSKSDNSLQQNAQHRSLTLSQVGSIRGDTVIAAGQELDAQAARLAAGGNLHLQGKEVNLDAGHVSSSQQTEQRSKQSGFAVGFTYDVYTAARNAYERTKGNGGYSNSWVGKWMQHESAMSKAVMAASTPVVVTGGRSRSLSEKSRQHSEAVVTSATAGKNLNIVATQGSINSQGAKLSAEGDAVLQAAEHIRLGFAADEQSQHSRSRRSGFSIDNRDHLTAGGTFNDRSQGDAELSRLTGTQLSAGGRASLQAERGDISLIGSSAVAEQDLTLRAGGDIRLLSSQNSSRSSEREISSGIGSAVISDTEHFNGWMKHTRQERQQQVEQVRSQIGSLNGSVRMHAGENYVQQVADVVAAQDIDIQAKRIDILTDHNRSSRYSAERDVKIGNFAKISSPILDLINAVEGTVKGKEDGRTRALQGMAAAAKGYSTVAGNGALFKAEVGFGFKTARSQQEQSDEHSQSNTLAAGRNLSLTSREGDIRLQNTQAKAGDTLSLDSARDIILEAGGNRQRADGKNSHLGVSGGVGVSVGAGTGIYAYVEVGGGKGENHLDAQSHGQTRLQAKHLVINSQRDTTLSGARAEAERIDAQVGGRLHIESLQDQLEQSSKQSQGGVRVQVSFGTAWEVSGNYSAAQTSGSSRSVAEQSGLFAGQGGYHIRADQVHLKGGAIASAAPAEHNELTANRLTFENLHNHSDYSAQSAAISGSYGYNPNNEPGYSDGPQYNPGLPQSDSGSSESTTYAVLSEGDIRIGGERTSAQALGIRTRLDGANESVAALPDLQRLLQRQRTVSQASADIIGAAQTYSSNRAKEAKRQKQQAEHDFQQAEARGDTVAQAEASARIKQAEQTKQEWGVGGSKNRALQAVTTVLTGSLGGQSGLQVASNTLAPYAATLIGDTFGQNGSHPNKAAQLLSHAILGAALAYTNGGDPAAGAASGAGAEAAAMVLTRTLYGEEAAKRPDLLPEQDKERIRTLSSAVAAVVGGVSGSRDGGGNAVDVLSNAQVGGVVGRNAVENNALLPNRNEYARLSSVGKRIHNLLTRNGILDINEIITRYRECRTDACRDGVERLHLSNESRAVNLILQAYRRGEVTTEELSDYLNKDLQILAHSNTLKNPSFWDRIRGRANEFRETKPNRNMFGYDPKDHEGITNITTGLGTYAPTLPLVNAAAVEFNRRRGGATRKEIETVNNGLAMMYDITSQRRSFSEATEAIKSGDFRNPALTHAAFSFALHQGTKAILNRPVSTNRFSARATGSSTQTQQFSPGSQSNPPVTQSMLEARYGKGNVQRGGGNSLATRERVHRNVQASRNGNAQVRPTEGNRKITLESLRAKYGENNVQQGGGNWLVTRERVYRNIQGNRAGNSQAQSASIGQMAWELQNGRLPGTPIGQIGTPRTMPSSHNPNASANSFAQTILGRRPTTSEYAAGAKMNRNNCTGCWRATLPDGSTVVYRPAGKASTATNPTTATVEIHNSSRFKAINNGNDLKFKFPSN